MTRLIRLWTENGESRFAEEAVEIDRTAARAVHLQRTPAGSALEWHHAPTRQYVITVTGTLRFTTRDGAEFVLAPGDVLLAEDTAGGGHRWQLLDDEPWTRIYVELE